MNEARAMEGESALQARCRHRCLVLVPAQAEVPGRLLAALHDRAMTAIVISDPPAVMVELARHGAASLIVVCPHDIARVQALVDAVRAYFPRTVCWQYMLRAKGGSLQPINGQVGRDDQVMERERAVLFREDQRRLSSLFVHVEGEAPEPEPLVSEDELAMLLGPLPEETAEEIA